MAKTSDFIRIIEELKHEEEKEEQRQDKDFHMIASVMRLHAEAQHELSKQIVRLNRSTTVLALTQIFLIIISIIIANVLSNK
jgi:hypothetical protein